MKMKKKWTNEELAKAGISFKDKQAYEQMTGKSLVDMNDYFELMDKLKKLNDALGNTIKGKKNPN